MDNKRKLVILGQGGGGMKTPYAVDLNMSIDSDYILSAHLIDQNGDQIGEEQTIELPLESMVVSGNYDDTTKSLILTLDNGNTITIPLSGLISGLQEEITNDNKLPASLVSGLSTVATTGQYSDLSGIPTIPTVNDSTITIEQDGVTAGTFTLNQSSNATISLTGGSGGGNEWFGSKSQFDSLSSYDYDTSYYIEDKLTWSEIDNKPFVASRVSQLPNDSNYQNKNQVNQLIKNAIKDYDSKNQWVTQAEYDTLVQNDGLVADTKYHIEGPQTTIQMVVTFTDQTTETYDVYVGN